MRILLIDDNDTYFGELRRALDAEYVPIAANTYDPRDGAITADIALTYNEYNAPPALLIQQLRRTGIPTLHVPDGILEWRNTWEHPELQRRGGGGMPLFQPVLSDKIACIGRSQARVLESWGNLGKCEIVGSPRFDPLIARQVTPPPDSREFRLLVVTAKTPFFTEPQRAKVRAALADLKAWVAAHPRIDGRRLTVAWRVTCGLDKELGLVSARSIDTRAPLADILGQVHAVVTTPSTVLLEAMLLGRPVALLDYTNSPQYVPAAWTISARQHLDETIPALAAPPPSRMLYQDMVLHDALECRSPATPRLIALIERMVEIARERRAAGAPLEFPTRVLTDGTDHHMPEERYDLRTLYPDHPVYANTDLVALQTEIGHMQNLANKARALAAAKETVALYERFGCGPLLARLVHTFPYPRRMLRAFRLWAAHRHSRRSVPGGS